VPSRSAALLFLSLVLLLAACERSPRRLVRLGSLVRVEKGAPVALPAGAATPAEPYRVAPGLSAARVAKLRLRARGSATLATLSWKLARDRGFPPFRTLSFPLVPDGREHLYEIDLQREPYWTGRVEVLRLAVDAGRLDLLALAGEPATEPYRSMSLGGESVPSLPGLARIELELPDGLPRGTVFETRLGLVPEYDRPGVRAAFRIYLEEEGRRSLWFAEEVAGGARPGWHLVRRELPARRGRLALAVAATQGGSPLPEGVALWGDPTLVAPGRREGRNLVVILVDTLRADALGTYGSREGLTPRIDAFARQGTRFAELFAPASWTLPSVSALSTGLQPQTHGAGQRYGNFAPTGLPGGVRTMAEALRQAGFYTVGVYHNIYVNPAFGLQQGFDEYLSQEERADVLVDSALARLRRYAPDRRFFLYLHLFDPHNPYEPPERECREVARRLAPAYHGPLGCKADRRPELPVPPAADRRWHEALYKGEIAFTDRQVGRFLDGLDALGLGKDTVVALLSDHGEEFWTRYDAERARGYEANGDHGHTLYQELLHVPGIVREPGRRPAVVAAPVEMVDLFPTLLHLSGVAPPPSEGQDLVPLLDGHAAERRPTLIADVLLHGPPRWSVQRGPWKLIVPREPGLPLELYDLARDPGETTNVLGERPDEARALGETLARPARPPTSPPASPRPSPPCAPWASASWRRAPAPGPVFSPATTRSAPPTSNGTTSPSCARSGISSNVRFPASGSAGLTARPHARADRHLPPPGSPPAAGPRDLRRLDLRAPVPDRVLRDRPGGDAVPARRLAALRGGSLRRRRLTVARRRALRPRPRGGGGRRRQLLGGALARPPAARPSPPDPPRAPRAHARVLRALRRQDPGDRPLRPHRPHPGAVRRRPRPHELLAVHQLQRGGRPRLGGDLHPGGLPVRQPPLRAEELLAGGAGDHRGVAAARGRRAAARPAPRPASGRGAGAARSVVV
jgi:arylsulfatase A-like enzyme